MSLNGLEDPKVAEAYEAAAAEPGGWFLLRYEGRDEIQVLSRGNGGIVEIRKAIASYEETSPLYGFLKYRRRSVIIKYLPDDCSRIIQARAAVHFTAVCERFAPSDTIFEITDSADLKDSKLSAACSLHTASGSTSSSTSSLRRRRLMEIAEEEEDEQRAIKRQTLNDSTESPPKTPTEPVKLDSNLASSPEHSKFAAETTSDVPTFVGAPDGNKDVENGDAESMQFDAMSYSGYSYTKPKIKLGPRPSTDVNTRPHTAGNFRPVSAIPSGFKLFGKGSKKSKGSDAASISSPQEEIEGLNFSVSSTSLADEASSRPATSSGIVFDPPVQPAAKKQALSPEKVRLMKAMKLRQKKKKLSMLPPAAPTVEGPAETAEDTTEIEDEAVETERATVDEKSSKQEDGDDSMQAGRDSIDKDDSGLGTDLSSPSPRVDQTFDQLSVSHPTNSVIASSDAELSTKASSISESTDETVHPKEVEDVPANNDQDDGSTPNEESPETQTAVAESERLATVEGQGASEDIKDEFAEEKASDGTQTVVVTAEEPAKEARLQAAEPSEAPAAAESLHTEAPQQDEQRSSLDGLPVPVSKFSPHAPLSPVDATTPLDDATAPVPADVDTVIAEVIKPNGKSTEASAEDIVAATKAASEPTVTPTPEAQPEPQVSACENDVEPVKDEETTKLDPATEEQKMDKKLKRRAQIEPLTTDMVFTDRPISDATIRASEEVTDKETETGDTTPAGDETPVTSNFPSSTPDSSEKPQLHGIRTVSNPVRSNLVTPTDASQSSTRSLSSGAAYLQKITQRQASGNLAKKNNNLGSSISQRIKALEKFSTTAGDAPAAAGRDRPSSTFYAVQKREPSRAPSVIERANSLRGPTPETPHDISQESSPEAKARPRVGRSGSVTKRMSMFESPPGARSIGLGAVGGAPIPFHGRPESVSVTAKIVRDPDQAAPARFEAPQNYSEYTPLELKQSPLLVDHQVGSPSRPPLHASPGTNESISTDNAADRGSDSGKTHKPRSGSLGIVRGFMKERRKSVASTSDAANIAGSPPKAEASPPSVLSPRLSISSPRSSFSRDRDVVMSPSESGSGDDTRSTNGDKKLSRTGRFMRRLSNLSSARGKTIPSTMSSSITEEDAAAAAQNKALLGPGASPSRPSTTGTPAIVAYMGDVNVQFPDNLLWKRRNMSLDSQGFLILSALPAQNGRPAQGTKRYHLGDFRPPYIPDVEVQELPNSVVLDFVDGSGIQVACEDRAGQLRILETLQEAHSTKGTTYTL